VSEELAGTFHRSVEEGEARLTRSWPALFATGAVGGIDVSIGVLGLLVVQQQTGSRLLGALAFGIGFIALTLAGSELFTENFLVPVIAVAAGRGGPLAVLRLWGGTLLTNLVGGWVMAGLVVAAVPELRSTAVEVGSHPATLGINGTAFASAVLGGAIITLMTWMERASESSHGKLIAAVAAAFLLAGARLQHAVVISLEMFAALHVGAPFGYADWLGAAAFAALGNAVGGLGLVTVLRLVQVGQRAIEQERDAAQ
jgi:formate/nitrite transporter FocA (FNT family)